MKRSLAIIGAGASGVFAAIRCAEVAREKSIDIDICIFEATSRSLKKVKISGGGRCNVTHNIFEVRDFCTNYPRGQKELISPFQVFQASDTVKWFKKRGVKLKHEVDGRMFPTTDSSETIINCFMQEINRLGIKILTKRSVKSIKKIDSGRFSLNINNQEEFIADAVLVATGSMPGGYYLAESLGHSITEIAPSLFTFKIQDIILEELAGTSFKNANLVLKVHGSKSFSQKGPLLITHWGLSGPALLKLSAWAAREMMHSNYKAKIIVNWLGFSKEDECRSFVHKIKDNNSKSLVNKTSPVELTKRFWSKLLEKSSIQLDKRWADLSKKEINALVSNLYACELEVLGKSRFKEEFVECGGVSLKEINFKTMESKICPGLYFSGEIMDVDGITGGFNFQNAWTSGWIAGTNMAIGNK